MDVVEIGLLLAGIVVLVAGYRRNHRNMLLTASILLFLSGAWGGAIQQFVDGYQQARSQGQ